MLILSNFLADFINNIAVVFLNNLLFILLLIFNYTPSIFNFIIELFFFNEFTFLIFLIINFLIVKLLLRNFLNQYIIKHNNNLYILLSFKKIFNDFKKNLILFKK